MLNNSIFLWICHAVYVKVKQELRGFILEKYKLPRQEYLSCEKFMRDTYA